VALPVGRRPIVAAVVAGAAAAEAVAPAAGERVRGVAERVVVVAVAWAAKG